MIIKEQNIYFNFAQKLLHNLCIMAEYVPNINLMLTNLSLISWTSLVAWRISCVKVLILWVLKGCE
jgi:hypothetical protein